MKADELTIIVICSYCGKQNEARKEYGVDGLNFYADPCHDCKESAFMEGILVGEGHVEVDFEED